jgi:hypothetical protein
VPITSAPADRRHDSTSNLAVAEARSIVTKLLAGAVMDDTRRSQLALTIAEALVPPAQAEIRRAKLAQQQAEARSSALRAELTAVTTLLHGLGVHMRADDRDWTANALDAWLHAVVLGWPAAHDNRPLPWAVRLEDIAARYRWSDARLIYARQAATLMARLRARMAHPSVARPVTPSAPPAVLAAVTPLWAREGVPA